MVFVCKIQRTLDPENPSWANTSREGMLEATHRAVATFAGWLCQQETEEEGLSSVSPEAPRHQPRQSQEERTQLVCFEAAENTTHKPQNRSDFCKWLCVHWFLWQVLPRKKTRPRPWTQKKKRGNLMTKKSKITWPAETKAADGDSGDTLDWPGRAPGY